MRNEDTSYFEEEEFRECLKQYETAIRLNQQPYMDADELTDIAEYYMINNREQDANKCILLATTMHPEAVDPQVFLARQQLFHNQMDKAREITSAILDQTDPEVKYLWAEIMIKEGDPDLADDFLRDYYEMLEVDADQFLYDTACIFADYELWTLALDWALRLKKEYPDFEKVDLLICDIQVSCGLLDEAIPSLEEMLRVDPFNKDAWVYLAEAQSAKERYEEALESIDYLLAIDEKNKQGRLIRANCLFRLNRIEESHSQYVEYLQENPNDANANFCDGMVLSNLERWDDAYNRLLLCQCYADPMSLEYFQSCLQMSFINAKLNKFADAKATLEEAYSTTGRELDSEYYFMSGHILLEAMQFMESSDCFDKAEKLSEEPYRVRYLRAVELIEHDFPHEAMQILQELMQSDWDEREENCYPYLAYVSRTLASEVNYKEYLRLAVEHNPSLTEFLFSPFFPNVPVSKYVELLP